MKKIYRNIFLLTLIFISLGTTTVAAQDVVIIVNPSNSVNSMSQIEAKLYYMRKIKQKWPSNGERIQPVMLSGSGSAKASFLTKIMKMSDSELNGYFKQRQFANGEKLPQEFSSETELINYVSENVGAIGFISKSAFDNAAGKVKAIYTQ